MHGVDCLKNNLLRIVTNVEQSNKQINKPELNAPTRKSLPSFGEETAGFRGKHEEDNNLRESFTFDCGNVRRKTIAKGNSFVNEARKRDYGT